MPGAPIALLRQQVGALRKRRKLEPANTDTLEAEWNANLRALSAAQERCEKKRETDRALDDEQRARITSLATDLPRLWNDPRTPARERKRMARLLIDDVTLLKADVITVQVRFKGGATRTLSVAPAKPAWMLRQTPPEVVAAIDRLLDKHTDGEIATLLNGRGMTSGGGKRFRRIIVARIRQAYGLKSRYTRLRARGLLDERAIAKRLKVKRCTIKIWRRAGLLKAHRYDDKGQCLFERPGDDAPIKYKHQQKMRGLSPRRPK